MMLEEEEIERHKLDRKIVERRALDALRRHRAAQAQHAPRRRACDLRQRTARAALRAGKVAAMSAQAAKASGGW